MLKNRVITMHSLKAVYKGFEFGLVSLCSLSLSLSLSLSRPKYGKGVFRWRNRGNPLPLLHKLLFSISSKGYFICTSQLDNTYHDLWYTSRATLAGKIFKNVFTFNDRPVECLAIRN